MGLFDPPAKNIRNKIPVALHTDFDLLSTAVLCLPELTRLSPQKQQYALGAVMSLWACKHAQLRTFDLKESEYRHIKNLGLNSGSFLGTDADRVLPNLIERLTSSGLIPGRVTDFSRGESESFQDESRANSTLSHKLEPIKTIPEIRPEPPVDTTEGSIRKQAYLSKYRIHENKLDGAIGLGRIKAFWHDGGMWVEDRRI